MSKIKKRDYKITKRNFAARQDLNRHYDIFKSSRREPKGGRHGEKDKVRKEVEDVQTEV